MKSDTGIRLTRSDYPQKEAKKVDNLTFLGILVDFRSDRFFDDKTGSGNFQGIVPNIFIRKSTIARRKKGLSTIFDVLLVFRVFRR